MLYIEYIQSTHDILIADSKTSGSFAGGSAC